MPSEDDNVKFLYTVLTACGTPSIDFESVGTDLELKAGAVSKRWSRLKQAMTEGKNSGPSAYQFLWLCVKYQNREGTKTPDWKTIAPTLNLTPGAASKRFSRLKISMESGAEPPKSGEKGGVKAAVGGDGRAKGKSAAKCANGLQDQVTAGKRKRLVVKQEKDESEAEGNEELKDTMSIHAGHSKITPGQAIEPESSPTKRIKTTSTSRKAKAKAKQVDQVKAKQLGVKVEPKDEGAMLGARDSQEEFEETSQDHNNGTYQFGKQYQHARMGMFQDSNYNLGLDDAHENNLRIEDWLNGV